MLPPTLEVVDHVAFKPAAVEVEVVMAELDIEAIRLVVLDEFGELLVEDGVAEELSEIEELDPP